MHGGFTLIEVMIVLTIVVGLMAIAWPRMRRMAAKSQIREAAVEFKTACTQARDQAAQLGQPVFVQYQFGSSEFRLCDSDFAGADSDSLTSIDAAADDLSADDLSADDRTGSRASSMGASEPYVADFELALGIVFSDPEVLSAIVENLVGADALVESNKRTGDSAIANDQAIDTGTIDTGTIHAGTAKGIAWNEAERIVFYPEGRATPAVVRLLAPDSGDSIVIRVRGLTAGVSIGDIEKPFTRSADDRFDRSPNDQRSPSAQSSMDPIHSEVARGAR